jgi:MoaA/NifB/PqqE/SkfB family radical SAM enzyme
MLDYKPGIHKLIQHVDHLRRMKTQVAVAPIHVSIWPTIRCQLSCKYCCCRNEDKSHGDLSFIDFALAVDVLKRYGTKAIEFSGGGEPLLWPHLEKAVDVVRGKGIKISLITNGLALKNIDTSKFDWIRISVVSMEQIRKVVMPKNTRVSLSYVLSENIDLDELYDFAKKKNLVTRVALPQPNMSNKPVKIKGYPLFFSKKEQGAPAGCYMPWIRAAIDWRGNFLPCPSVQLVPEYKGRVDDRFKLCHVSQLEKWLQNNRAHDMRFKCSFCNCGKEHNDLLHSYFHGVKDADFV